MTEGLASGFAHRAFAHRAFALCIAGHPSARGTAVDPVQGRQPSPSLGVAARFASRLDLRASPRCLESVSTTDVRVTSTRRSTTFGDLIDRRGKPAGDRLRILRTRRFRRAFVKDAGPPRGHPASNGRAVDGAQPALVTRQPRPRFRVTVGGAAAALSANEQPCRGEPLTPCERR